MQGWLWPLRQPELSAERQRQGLDTLERNIALQCRLVEDLLDASRAVAGRLALESRLVDLPGVIRIVADLAQTEAREKGVCNKATLTVRDTGIGIAPGFLPHVFDHFRQEDATSVRAYGGLGIGLTIVQHLVRPHSGSGSVSAESEGKNRGSVIRVELPIPAVLTEPGSWLRRRVGGAEPAAADLHGLIVLVIDDEIDAALSALSAEDYAPVTSAAGFETFLQKPVSPDELAATVARLGRRRRETIH